MSEPEYNNLEQNIKALRALDPPLSGFVADLVEVMVRGDTGKLTRKLYRALATYVEAQVQDSTLPAPMPESAIRTAIQGLALGVLPVEVNPCIDTLTQFLMNLQQATIPGAPRAANPEERSKDPFCQQGKKQPWDR